LAWQELIAFLQALDPKDVPELHAAELQRTSISLGRRIARLRRDRRIAAESLARLALRTLGDALILANGRGLVEFEVPNRASATIKLTVKSADDAIRLYFRESPESPERILGMVNADEVSRGRGRKFDLADPSSEENIRQFITDAGFKLAPRWLDRN
jgi:hypothetical protein